MLWLQKFSTEILKNRNLYEIDDRDKETSSNKKKLDVIMKISLLCSLQCLRTMLVLLAFVLLISCDDNSTNTQPVSTSNFNEGIRSLLASDIVLKSDHSWGTPAKIELFGFQNLTEASLDTLDAFFVYGIYPGSNCDLLFYNQSLYKPIISVTAFFKGNNSSLDTNYNVSFNNTKLAKFYNAGTYYIIPRLALTNNYKDSNYHYGQKVPLTISTKDGLSVNDTLEFRTDLFPLTLNDNKGTINKYDTLSYNQDIIVKWGTAQPNEYVTSNYYVDDGYDTEGFIRTRNKMPDNGLYTISKQEVTDLGIYLFKFLAVELIRYNYNVRVYPEINKKVGFLSYTHAFTACYLKK